jgi:hypothetical protein
MADDMNQVTDDSASTATNDAQPGSTLLTDPSLIADGEEGKADKSPADTSTDAPEGKDGDKAETSETDGDKPEGEKDGETDKPEGAPEKYELTLPEGYVIDEALLADADPILRELNLNNEQASKLASLVAKVRVDDETAADTAWREQVNAWTSDVKNDKEMGGEHFKPSMIAAQKAITEIGTPELAAALSETGMGNHPEFVRFCARVGKMMAEDKFIRPDAPSGDEPKGLYGHLPSKS